MISIVLYGRNDTHGYNLHKRAALAINGMAELLTDVDDEILFVDYNTPDDYPTFPEAIADTLTARARAQLRVLRVRPAVHERYRARTHLDVLEPVARNVAVRRSNPRNPWILSTNTDMIFVPRSDRSLSDIASGLEPGFYHLPRFELPESLWEGFDRQDPARVIQELGVLGRTLFLNEIVYSAPVVKYDGPGDFQLIRRDDLFRIHGFDEAMLRGWHVDSNIAKRLYLLYGHVGDLVELVFGYHCDHTRQVTPAHRLRTPSNDTRVFVDEVTEPALEPQARVWGCADDEIEEVLVGAAVHRSYVTSLRATLDGEWTEPAAAVYRPETRDRVDYDPRHVLPFLADLFVSAPRHWNVGWIGGRAEMFRLFCAIWDRLGFSGSIHVPGWSAPLLGAGSFDRVRCAEPEALAEAADAIVFDFGAPAGGSAAEARLAATTDVLLRRSLARLVATERTRLAGGAPPRRFVCVNAIHNVYESLVSDEIATAATPFSSRLRHGFVMPRPVRYGVSPDDVVPLPAPGAPNLIDAVQVGEAGERVGRAVRAPFGRRGVVLHGPHSFVPPGLYHADVSMEAHGISAATAVRPVIVDVLAGDTLIARSRRRIAGSRHVRITFRLSDECARVPVYCRIFCGRSTALLVTSIRLTRVTSAGVGDDAPLAQLIAQLVPAPRPEPMVLK